MTLRPDGDPEALRHFTDQLMHEIAGLAGRPYVDRYVERGAPDRWSSEGWAPEREGHGSDHEDGAPGPGPMVGPLGPPDDGAP